jgi:hypothetical protein
MYFKILFLNYHQDIFLENWDIEPWAWHMFSSFCLGSRVDIPSQMEFANICGLLLDGNKCFCWTSVHTASEELAHVIRASQSIYTLSWV